MGFVSPLVAPQPLQSSGLLTHQELYSNLEGLLSHCSQGNTPSRLSPGVRLGPSGPRSIAGWEWKGNAGTRVFLIENAVLFDPSGVFATISLVTHPQG